MAPKKHIKIILKKFYLCTHLPIQAYKLNGELIHRKGFDTNLESLVNNKKYDMMIKESLNNKDKNPINIHYLNNICFTSYYIDDKYLNNLIFILGPYSTFKENRNNIIYKPANIFKYYIILINEIIDDKIYDIGMDCQNKKFYTLHVKKALNYINLMYSEDITLNSVSNYLGINKSYLASLLKEETGKTFTEILNEIRIEKSKELLSNTNLSALDIALTVGYNNQNYYNIVFKKFTNKTPLEFRHSLEKT